MTDIVEYLRELKGKGRNTMWANREVVSGCLSALLKCEESFCEVDPDSELVVATKEAILFVNRLDYLIAEYLSKEPSSPSNTKDAKVYNEWIDYLNDINNKLENKISTRTIRAISRELGDKGGVDDLMSLTDEDVLSWRGAGKLVSKEVKVIQDYIEVKAIQGLMEYQNESERDV